MGKKQPGKRGNYEQNYCEQGSVRGMSDLF